MNELINEEIIGTIRATGKTDKRLPDRIDLLEKYNLPYDRAAENVIITGCQILSSLPWSLKSLSRLLDSADFSHTFLSEEYCCGNYLYRPSIAARDEEGIKACQKFSREFLSKNIETAKSLEASRLIIFCSPCYPIYKHAFPEEKIIFYTAALEEIMGNVDYAGEIDYYAGCYKLHKRMSPVPMDLASSINIFKKIKGLDVNKISAPDCCFKPRGLKHMMDNIQTEEMIHICTGCYGTALANNPEKSRTSIKMLPEFLEKIILG